jgi:hypothetical protein
VARRLAVARRPAIAAPEVEQGGVGEMAEIVGDKIVGRNSNSGQEVGHRRSSNLNSNFDMVDLYPYPYIYLYLTTTANLCHFSDLSAEGLERKV